jgi:hypothetical protein
MLKLGHMICNLRSDGYSENAAISMAKLNGNTGRKGSRHVSGSRLRPRVHPVAALRPTQTPHLRQPRWGFGAQRC